MATRTVFIISPHLLFRYGLQSLLDQEKSVTIVGQELGVDQALGQIESLQPDVVILDSKSSLLTGNSEVVHILAAAPNARVIYLSLNSNKLQVYRVKQWLIRNLEDLLDIVADDQPSSLEDSG